MLQRRSHRVTHISPLNMKAVLWLTLLFYGLIHAGVPTKRQTPVENNPLGTPNLVVNGNFTDGTSGWVVEPSGTIQNGMLCITVPANTFPNASFIHTTNNFTEVKNDVYFLNFTAYASHAVNLWLQTSGFDPSAGGAPVDPNLNTTECPLTTTAHAFTFPFSPANQENNSTLTFNLGGNNVTTNICIGNISLHRINRLPYYQETGPSIKVNQVGYLPDGPKHATLVSQSKQAVTWQLLDSSGSVVSSGKTVPYGNDTSSGLNVHTIDFTSYTQIGSSYTLAAVGGKNSFPFAISSTLYDSLRQDSMQFFYQQRSGIAIDGQLVGNEYARAAGHLQVAPNQVCVADLFDLHVAYKQRLMFERVILLFRASTNGNRTSLTSSHGRATIRLMSLRDGKAHSEGYLLANANPSLGMMPVIRASMSSMGEYPPRSCSWHTNALCIPPTYLRHRWETAPCAFPSGAMVILISWTKLGGRCRSC